MRGTIRLWTRSPSANRHTPILGRLSPEGARPSPQSPLIENASQEQPESGRCIQRMVRHRAARPRIPGRGARRPSRGRGPLRRAAASGAPDSHANGDSESAVIPLTSTERRKGFEPSTPSLGSWPRALERRHGVLALPVAGRPDLRTGLPETASGKFGSTFDERVVAGFSPRVFVTGPGLLNVRTGSWHYSSPGAQTSGRGPEKPPSGTFGSTLERNAPVRFTATRVVATRRCRRIGKLARSSD